MQSAILLLVLLFSLLLLASSAPLRASTAHSLRAKLPPALLPIDESESPPLQVASILPPPLHPSPASPSPLLPASITPSQPFSFPSPNPLSPALPSPVFQIESLDEPLLLTPASILPAPPSSHSSSPLIGEAHLQSSDVLSMSVEDEAATSPSASDVDAKRSRVRLYKLRRWLSERASAPKVVYSQ